MEHPLASKTRVNALMQIGRKFIVPLDAGNPPRGRTCISIVALAALVTHIYCVLSVASRTINRRDRRVRGARDAHLLRFERREPDYQSSR
jgi:hypothetical protein